MTSVSPDGPASRLPRHVWVLLVLVVVVLGFAVGGSLRSALAATASGVGPPASGAGMPVAATASAQPSAGLAAPAAAAAAPARVVPTASRQGKALPKGSDAAGTGRRIVYQESTMHLWVVGDDGVVVRDYRVTGRPGWPKPGTYHVFSKVASTASPKYGVTFRWMVRFAHGHELNIGFHDIPRFMGSGRPIQSEANLGAPIGHGGCVRQRTVDAIWLYGWAKVGTPVVVLR